MDCLSVQSFSSVARNRDVTLDFIELMFFGCSNKALANYFQ